MWKLPAALLAALALLSAAPSRAAAGSYRVRTCATDPSAGMGEEMQATFDPALMSAERRCEVDRQVQLNAAHGVRWAPGAGGAWTLRVPPDTRLTQAHLRLEGRSRDGILAQAEVWDGGRPVSAEPIVTGDTVDYDWWGSADAVGIALRCALPVRGACRTGPAASWAVGRNFDLSLSDDVPPAAPDLSGGLVDGAWQRGRRDLAWSAADRGGGVDHVELRVDGQLVQVHPAPCARGIGFYTRVAPCPPLWSGELALETGALADGAHALELASADVGGGVTARPFGIRVDNTAPAAPEGLAADPPGWSRAESFALRWRLSHQEPGAPVAAAWVRVGNEPGEQVAGRDLAGVDGLRVDTDGEVPVRVWLADEAGNVDERRSATAILRHDATPPTVELGPRDPSDPARIAARFGDATSGLATTSLAWRPAGETDWRPLAAGGSDADLAARFPDGDVPPGAYEVRAAATDRAGSTAEAIGEIASPLRAATRVEAGLRRDAPGGARTAPAARVLVASGARAELAGRATDAAGAPLADTELGVESRLDAPGEELHGLATVRTGPDGAFSLPVEPGASRRLRVTLAGSRTLLPASAEARLGVRAGVSLAAVPALLHNRGRVRFRGRLATGGAPLPPHGKLVVVQYRDGRGRGAHWRPLAVVRTDGRGRFRAAHRFRTVRRRAAFAFRAVCPHESGVALSRGVSPPRRVVVLPRLGSGHARAALRRAAQ